MRQLAADVCTLPFHFCAVHAAAFNDSFSTNTYTVSQDHTSRLRQADNSAQTLILTSFILIAIPSREFYNKLLLKSSTKSRNSLWDQLFNCSHSQQKLASLPLLSALSASPPPSVFAILTPRHGCCTMQQAEAWERRAKVIAAHFLTAALLAKLLPSTTTKNTCSETETLL